MPANRPLRIKVVDSHTGGEPTRVVIGGGPDLAGATLAEKREDFRDRFDTFRSAVVNEPRGSDVVVGALLLEPTDPTCAAGVIFFNNVGYLGMCGHGTIGLIETLRHRELLTVGIHRIETPVGIVAAELHQDGMVSVHNVPAYRYAKGVRVNVEGHGTVTGDVAWGGNWFFLCEDHGQEITLPRVEALTDFSWRVRRALERENITGADGAEIDHIELFGAPETSADLTGENVRIPRGPHSRNFVLCPGGAYDRSPCGTGTSAKLACLAADNKLASGEIWRQESIVGTVFEGSYEPGEGNTVHPTIRGRAFVNAEATLLLNRDDPFCWGIRHDGV